MPSNEFDCRSGYRGGEREGDNERDKATERDSMRERKWGEGLRKRKGGERERGVGYGGSDFHGCLEEISENGRTEMWRGDWIGYI